MKKSFTLCSVLFLTFVFGQEKDSLTLISEVMIDAYEKPVSFLKSTKSVAVASTHILQNSKGESLQQSLNLLPGTRMEERSPGSYRLSVRGSTLRSPFGIRNVKIYLDDFILTDATGNSYLNILDPALFSSIEIYKGPEAGDFGAATGGTALMRTRSNDGTEFDIKAGSYGQFSQNLALGKKSESNYFKIFESSYSTQSYREQSALQRKNLFLKNEWKYASNQDLRATLLLSDLHYETPGGLTLQQMTENRRQARPATATLPSAVEQRAGIYNKTILAGVSHRSELSSGLSHFIVFQHSYTDLRNPFITNFEKRFENNTAARTHFNYARNFGSIEAETRLGLEAGSNSLLVKNFNNNFGEAGTPQRFDKIKTGSAFYFVSQNLQTQKWNFDAAVSLNNTGYSWETLFPERENGEIRFNQYLLPSFGFTYFLNKDLSIRAKIAKGNSAPTSEEIRSSTKEINFNLQPEYGWNRELGFRKQFEKALFVELSYFDFRLEDAIVRLQNENGEEYFANAGSTRQSGFEFLAETRKFNFNAPISEVQGWFSGNLYDFQYLNYKKDHSDYSGNNIPGVPSTSFQAAIRAQLYNRLNIRWTTFYTSKMFLDDANTTTSEPSFVNHLSFELNLRNRTGLLNLSMNIQNIFNEKYVSGYDINAFGKRFYNPAALRNFNFGLNFTAY